MSDIPLLPEVEAFFARQHGQFINGQLSFDPASPVIDIVNPATGKVAAQVHQASDAELEQAVSGAKAAFEGAWRNTSPARRGELLNKLADLMVAHREELAQIETRCSGKVIALARGFEVDYAVQFLRYYAGWATKIGGRTMSLSLPSGAGEQYTGYTLREPVGVMAGIVPWNFSIMIAVWKFGAALTCGCTAVIKPSEYTPLTMLRVAELGIEAGIPPGVLNVLNGAGAKLGAGLIDHPSIAKVSFTGSVPTGTSVGIASMKAGLKHVTLELGGKNAAGFLPDYPVEKIVEGVLEAGYMNQGQICASAERFYVHRSKIDAVLEALAKRLAAIPIGSPMDETIGYGPLANKPHFEKIMALFAKARDQGGQVVYGAESVDLEGYFVKPTAIRAKSQNDAIMREETFGPVGSFLAYDEVDELVEYMNDSPFGLTASIWTNDLSSALRIIPRIEAGTVWVNMHNFLDPAVPFGGAKQSGIGREFGEAFIENFTELKSVMIRY